MVQLTILLIVLRFEHNYMYMSLAYGVNDGTHLKRVAGGRPFEFKVERP